MPVVSQASGVPATSLTVELGEAPELGYYDSLLVRGTGCIDEATGSGSGLLVTPDWEPASRLGGPFLMVRDAEKYRSSRDYNNNLVSVNDDGTFDGYLVAADTAAPGVISVRFICVRDVESPQMVSKTGYHRVTLRADLGGITFTPSPARPGETVEWRVDCGASASVSYTTVQLSVVSRQLTATVSDRPYARGTLVVPSTASSATLPALATCKTERVGTHRHPTGQLEVMAP